MPVDWLKIAIYACGFGSAAFAPRALRDLRDVFDEAYGDVPSPPEEMQFGGRQKPGAGKPVERPTAESTSEVRTHRSGGNTP